MLQNRQWSFCGTTAIEIERHMFEFRSGPARRIAAIAEHAAWVEAQAGEDPDDHIPWRQEAALFANIYWSNRRRYEAEFAKASD